MADEGQVTDRDDARVTEGDGDLVTLRDGLSPESGDAAATTGAVAMSISISIGL